MQETQETQVWSLGQEDPWRRKWQPTPVFLPAESHEQRSLSGYRPWGDNELDRTERLNDNIEKMYKAIVAVSNSWLYVWHKKFGVLFSQHFRMFKLFIYKRLKYLSKIIQSKKKCVKALPQWMGNLCLPHFS